MPENGGVILSFEFQRVKNYLLCKKIVAIGGKVSLYITLAMLANVAWTMSLINRTIYHFSVLKAKDISLGICHLIKGIFFLLFYLFIYFSYYLEDLYN